MRIWVSAYAPGTATSSTTRHQSYGYDTVAHTIHTTLHSKRALSDGVARFHSRLWTNDGTAIQRVQGRAIAQSAQFVMSRARGVPMGNPLTAYSPIEDLSDPSPPQGNNSFLAGYGIDPLDEYMAPTIPPVRSAEEEDWAFLDDLFAVPVPVTLQSTAPYYNTPFGYVEWTEETAQEAGMGADRVPVYIINADLQQDPNTFYHSILNVVRPLFNMAYERVLAGRPRNANDYAQIRLKRPEGSEAFFDIVSDLTPAYETVDDFIIAFELLFQSETNKNERRMGGFLSELMMMNFVFTFVLADDARAPEQSMITVNNIAQVRQVSNRHASNARQQSQGANLMLSRNRWVQQHNLNVSSRVASLGTDGFDASAAQQFLDRRSFANESSKGRKRPIAILGNQLEAHLDPNPVLYQEVARQKKAKPAQESGKRAYKARRSAEEISAIRTLGENITDVSQYLVVQGVPVKIGRMRTNVWTQEQRDENNRVRRAKYAESKEVHGIYDELKKRIFHHSSIEQFFQHSKAVLQVPNTWKEGYCLAMAFIKSECRTYLVDGTSTTETSPYPFQPEQGEYATAPLLPSFAHLQGQDCDFITGDSLLLFNPYKYPSGESDSTVKYALKPSESIIQKWYQAAQNLHLFVSQEVEMELDENSEATLQAYADVFDVHIALYNLEVRGKRTVVIKPKSVPEDLRKTKQFRVVSLLISDSHCSAITNLRAFLKNNTSANRAGLHNYCVFCEKVTTANNLTTVQATAHFVDCIEKKCGLLCCDSDNKIRSKGVRDIHPQQFLYDGKNRCHKCRLCGELLEHGVQIGQIHHVCYMDKEKKPKMGDPNEIYVYDFECEQVRHISNSRTFIHRVNLVCVRRIYPDANGDCDRHCFATLEEFMGYVMSQSSSNRVYLAHNGSKYDVQFIVKHLEKNMIPHQFVPAPSSMHSYLRVSLSFGAKSGAVFLDFRHFMPGSLKNIAVSFGLSLQKGDFPHHFNNGEHEFYEGRIPLLDHVDDYWCLMSKKSEEEVHEFRGWYATQELVYCNCAGECVCAKEKWSFQKEIIKYCWLDVDVLAEACSRYRGWTLSFGEGEASIEGWTAQPIDPFQYLTIPQLAMTTLMAGLPEEENVTITPYKMRTDRVPLAIAWMERMQLDISTKIHHIANWHKEFFEPKTQRFLDGVTDDMHVFVCLNCLFHSCPFCYNEEIQTGVDHPSRPATYGRIADDTEHFIQNLFKTYGSDKTHIVWAHDLVGYTPYEEELGLVMIDREMFKGGRTEVFSPFCNADMYPDEQINYFDVCSLYPYVCAFTELPTGHPEHYCGSEIDRNRLLLSNHPDCYRGYVRCTVQPHREDKIGLLPCHDPKSGRLEFPLNEMTGSWGTEELRLAYENGYVVKEVYEVYHWTKEERSDTFMRGYVSFFLRMKQEAEGWRKLGASSEDPSEQEKLELVETLFHENGCIGRIRPHLVRKNAINRTLAKTFLNSLWGKFCQRAHTDHYSTIHGYGEFAQLWNDPHLDRRKVSFRHLSHGTWKVKYHLHSDFAKENPRYNIFIAAKVTETARCILHRQMLKIGPERILYCDTDSLMFLWPKDGEKLDAHGLGKWVDEYPRQRIKRLYALAPKFYYLEFEEDALLKSKGIMMNWTNRALLHGKSLGAQLLELFFPRTDSQGHIQPFEGFIPMKNMLMGIHTTSTQFEYGTMLTKETNDKKLRPVLTKRHLVPYLKEKNVPYDVSSGLDKVARIYTIPKGYYQNVEQMSDLMY